MENEESRNHDRMKEVIRFVITGGVCFLIEFAALVALRDGAGKQGSAQRAGFLVTSAVGLGLNEVLMLLFRAIFGEDTPVLTVFGFTVTMYMVNKVMATIIVMVWNYFTKKWILSRQKGS